MQEIGNKIPTIKERFLYVLECKGIVKDKFCNKIGMTYGNFTGKAKETPLNSTAIGNILLELPDLNPDWLILGTGKMLRDGTIEEKEDIPVKIIDNNSMGFILDRYEALVAENALLKKEVEDLKNSRGKSPDLADYIINQEKITGPMAAEPK